MSDLSTQLPQRLTRPEETGLDAGLLIPLLRLLVDGDPVTVEQLAAAASRTLDDVRRGLAAVPDTEYDDQGRIIGQGLTLRPTPHRFTVAGEELYTWCALDTLIFPTLLERAASVESVSPTSGEPIRVTIDPVAGVTSVEPATARVHVQPGATLADIDAATAPHGLAVPMGINSTTGIAGSASWIASAAVPRIAA